MANPTSSRRLRRSTLWIFVLTLVSRISGFFRTSILAAAFGTSMNTDAWVMASALPSLLFGSVNQAVVVSTVPAMTDARAHESDAELQRFISQVWTMLILGALVMTLLGELFAPQIIGFLAHGFHGAKRERTILMTRIMIPSIVFWSSSGFLTGILQADENFFGLTLAPLVANLVQIFGILVLAQLFHPHIEGVAVGFTLSIAMQLALLLPLMRRRGVRLRLTFRFDHPRIPKLLRLMGPYFILSSAGNIELITDRMLASYMAVGSISAMNFAFTVSQVPLGIIIAPVITPIFTRLAMHHSASERQAFSGLAMRGLRWVLMLALPLSLILFIMNVPILRFVYERGHFNRASLHLTSHLFVYAILALPANALATYLQQISFASKDTRRPARYSLVGVAVNIAGNLTLTRFMGVYGLVFATTIANWTNCILLTSSYNVRRHVGRQLPFVGSLALAGGVMAGILLGFQWLLDLNHVHETFRLVGGVGLAGAAAMGVFAGLLLLLQVPEARQVRDYALRRLKRGLALG